MIKQLLTILLTSAICSTAMAAPLTPGYVTKAKTGSVLMDGTIYDNGNIGIGSAIPRSKLDVNGTVTASAFVGNASTASALAANGANCSSGNYPLGVDASGAVESCTALPSSMVYPGAGIALSTGSAWGTSITDASANWNTAYTDRLKWDGGSTGLVAATGRTSLGLGSAAQSASTDFEVPLTFASGLIRSTNTINVDSGIYALKTYVTGLGYLTAIASDSDWTVHGSYPSACSAGSYVTAIGDTLTCGTPSGSGDMTKAVYDTNSNNVVDTATALAANGSNCASNYYPKGVDASGAAEDCVLIDNTIYQAHDDDLTTYAGITPSANIQTLLGSADYSTARTNLGLAIGTNVQAYNSNLTGINQALTSTSSPSFTTVTANLTGNASGTAATVTGAAQTAITSVGTLTALNVTGNVGVGTTVPIYGLSVKGTFGVGATTSGDTIIATGGNVGMGTNVPRAKLEVGTAASIVTGSAPALLVKNNVVVDGKIYGTSAQISGSGYLSPVGVTSDPCATQPEGTLFYNSTNHEWCTCDNSGVDLRIKDSTTACF